MPREVLRVGGQGRDVRYAMSIHAFSTSSVMPTYFELLSGFASLNSSSWYSTTCIAGAVDRFLSVLFLLLVLFFCPEQKDSQNNPN